MCCVYICLNFVGLVGIYWYVLVVDVFNGYVLFEVFVGKLVLIGVMVFGVFDIFVMFLLCMMSGVEVLVNVMQIVFDGSVILLVLFGVFWVMMLFFLLMIVFVVCWFMLRMVFVVVVVGVVVLLLSVIGVLVLGNCWLLLFVVLVGLLVLYLLWSWCQQEVVLCFLCDEMQCLVCEFGLLVDVVLFVCIGCIFGVYMDVVVLFIDKLCGLCCFLVDVFESLFDVMVICMYDGMICLVNGCSVDLVGQLQMFGQNCVVVLCDLLMLLVCVFFDFVVGEYYWVCWLVNFIGLEFVEL